MDSVDVLDRLKCVLFPPRCFSCGSVVCYEDLFCEKCGFKRPDAGSCSKKLCGAGVSGVIAGTEYSGGLRNAIWAIKEKPDIRVRNFFAERMLAEINGSWTGFTFDFVTSVPSSPSKLKKRGFNQAGFLAKELAARLNVPYAEAALAKNDISGHGHMLDANQRRESPGKAFYIADAKSAEGKSVLLVDDVLITGATLRACSGLLLEVGAKSVYIAAASSTPDSVPIKPCGGYSRGEE